MYIKLTNKLKLTK